MKTPIIDRFAGLLLAVLFTPTLPAAESFKWQDADGTVHYGQIRPTDGSSVDKVLIHDEQEELARARRNLELARLTLERDQGLLDLQRSRQAPPAAIQAARPQTLAATDMSYADRQKLRQIERDIERVSTSSFGTVQDRQTQINALTRQRDIIYGGYGVQPGTTVTIQDNRTPPAPAMDYYPVPPQ
ncbi:MAG: DUF4124 domain-containing protein, partial [Methylococcaceae bacterium]|nr:DUF4124 domain-containing protein [Methylococcaceae bacterium]